MEGIVVAHTEKSYFDPVEIAKELDTDNVQKANKIAQIAHIVFDKIANEIRKYITAGNKVYYLADDSKSPDSDSIYPAIRAQSSNMTFIPMDGNFEKQCLRAKEHVIADNVDKVVVSGVAYDCCVSDMYHLLLGEEGPNSKINDYQHASNGLGWSIEKFKKIFNTKLNAVIRSDLTNKLV